MSGKPLLSFFKPYRPLTHLHVHLLAVVARARKLFPIWAKVSLRTRAGARTLIGGGCIFIYSGSARLVSFVIKLISKEISRA